MSCLEHQQARHKDAWGARECERMQHRHSQLHAPVVAQAVRVAQAACLAPVHHLSLSQTHLEWQQGLSLDMSGCTGPSGQAGQVCKRTTRRCMRHGHVHQSLCPEACMGGTWRSAPWAPWQGRTGPLAAHGPACPGPQGSQSASRSACAPAHQVLWAHASTVSVQPVSFSVKANCRLQQLSTGTGNLLQ